MYEPEDQLSWLEIALICAFVVMLCACTGHALYVALTKGGLL